MLWYLSKVCSSVFKLLGSHYCCVVSTVSFHLFIYLFIYLFLHIYLFIYLFVKLCQATCNILQSYTTNIIQFSLAGYTPQLSPTTAATWTTLILHYVHKSNNNTLFDVTNYETCYNINI